MSLGTLSWTHQSHLGLVKRKEIKMGLHTSFILNFLTVFQVSIVPSLYRWENWDSERISNLPRTTEQVNRVLPTMEWGWWHCTGDRDQDHSHRKEMQKSKMTVWGGLTNSCEKKRSEKQRRKGKIQNLNAEFQRIARRDKKAFFSHQCKKIEENNRMGKNRDLFKKIRDNISCKDGLDKGQKWYGPNRSRRY